MKFLADMAISVSTVDWLRHQHHDVIHVRDEDMQRAGDDIIMAKALNEGRILLTLDLDFGYLLAISGAILPSVIIFRLGNETAEIVTKRLAETLEFCGDDLLSGAIVTVDNDTIRVRMLPLTHD